ncbi:MAG: hypothetical protein METHAR1v1_640011 [Methanothrix sp.]|nr:MAG: hypothetical protein METHAR1v1_640011 [Methanothrix sp.]
MLANFCVGTGASGAGGPQAERGEILRSGGLLPGGEDPTAGPEGGYALE